MKWLMALAALVATAACVPSPAGVDAPPSPAPAESASGESSEAPLYEPRDPPPSGAVSDCEPDVRESVEDTIRGQQRAFVDGDFRRARSFASDSFRSVITVDEFAYLIEMEYGFLLVDPVIDFGPCVQLGDSAEIRVDVEGLEQRSMAYRLVRENDGWFIDGARLTREGPAVTA